MTWVPPSNKHISVRTAKDTDCKTLQREWGHFLGYNHAPIQFLLLSFSLFQQSYCIPKSTKMSMYLPSDAGTCTFIKLFTKYLTDQVMHHLLKCILNLLSFVWLRRAHQNRSSPIEGEGCNSLLKSKRVIIWFAFFFCMTKIQLA